MVYNYTVILIPFEKLQNALIYRLCAKASAAGKHADLVPGKAELFLSLSLGHGIESLSYRKPCNSDLRLYRGVKVLGILNCEHYSICLFGKQLCCNACEGVCLMDSGRYAHLLSLSENRSRDIAACSDNKIGLEVLYYLL